jgi:Carboxypeptidase regulatory-like domain
MEFTISVPLAVLLFCAPLFRQSATPGTQPQTFHVRGTITDPLEAVIRGVQITFQNEQLSKTVTTNNVGVYEADLPLGGYTMTAHSPGFRLYRRPLFRVTSPTATAVLNATLLVGNPCGDMIIVNSWEKPVTEEQRKAATEHCRREELIPIPSGNGLPLQLSIRYGSRTPIGGTYSYTGEKTGQYQTPVFVAYNLFSLQADKVTYDVQKRTIEASGNVIAVNESGATQRANSMAFKIENGQVVLLR